jgi:hypothetical protein
VNNEQRQNLVKLADYLESLPERYKHFNMSSFADHNGDCNVDKDFEMLVVKKPEVFLSNCGTVACAVGHGPAAGLAPILEEFDIQGRGKQRRVVDFDWHSYTVRVFGVYGLTYEFSWMFGGMWSDIDNHHYGAAARIRYFLDTSLTPLTCLESVELYAPYRKGNRKEVTA